MSAFSWTTHFCIHKNNVPPLYFMTSPLFILCCCENGNVLKCMKHKITICFYTLIKQYFVVFLFLSTYYSRSVVYVIVALCNPLSFGIYCPRILCLSYGPLWVIFCAFCFVLSFKTSPWIFKCHFFIVLVLFLIFLPLCICFILLCRFYFCILLCFVFFGLFFLFFVFFILFFAVK